MAPGTNRAGFRFVPGNTAAVDREFP